MNARLEELVRVSRQLVDQLAEQAQADVEAFREAFRLGFESGVQVGRMRLDHELVEQDRRQAKYIRGIANSPSYAELERRRWDGRREDFGKPRPGDFPGVAAAARRREAARRLPPLVCGCCDPQTADHREGRCRSRRRRGA